MTLIDDKTGIHAREQERGADGGVRVKTRTPIKKMVRYENTKIMDDLYVANVAILYNSTKFLPIVIQTFVM